jgi:hypothetical protein
MVVLAHYRQLESVFLRGLRLAKRFLIHTRYAFTTRRVLGVQYNSEFHRNLK